MSTLKATLEATTDAVTLNPGRASVKLEADGALVGPCEVRARVGDWTLVVDEPEALGGADAAPNPLQMALVALCSCQAITYRLWAEKKGITLDDVEVSVRGTTDIRGLLGVSGAARPGFTGVSIDVRISGPEDRDTYEELRRTVDAHCPVFDVFAAPLTVTTRLRGT